MPTIYYPYIGGITVHVDNLIKHLKNVEFHILTYNYSEPKYKNIVVHEVPHIKKFRGISYLLNGYKIAKKIIEKEEIDIIHSHYAFPQGYLGAILKDKYNIPFILTLHGSDVFKLKNSFLGSYFFNYSINSADEIICVSREIKNMVGRGRVIYNGVDNYYNKGDEGFILFVGSFVPQKGVDILAEVSRDINYKFIFIGDGPLFNKVKKITKDNVILLGKKDHNEVIDYISRCSFLVVPSRVEGLGLVALEAFSCSKPVVANNVGGLKEIVIDKYNGLLSNNKEELRENIITLIENKQLREKLGKNAKEFSKKFSWKNMAKEVLSVYQKFLKS